MARLYFQGHGSFRVTTDAGKVIYVDPYAGDGYEPAADLILVTHQHGDHNQVHLCAQNEGCMIITEADALKGGVHNAFDLFDAIKVIAVPAENKNHNPLEAVGYIIELDGVKVYAAGDTSTTEAMGGMLPPLQLDYTLLPCDGVYNMDLDEAAACAEKIGARFNIPIHMKPGELFDMERANAYAAPNKLIVPAGTEIRLWPKA